MKSIVATRSADTGIPVLDVDPYRDELLEDPRPLHETVRRSGPIVYFSRYGVYAMGRHRDVQPALRDWETYSSTGGSGIADIRRPDAWRQPSPIVEVDPPLHTRVRKALQKILSPGLIRQLRDQFTKTADTLLAELGAHGTFCGVNDLAEAYVATTFPAALGLKDSPGRRENLYLLGEWNFDGQGPANDRFLRTDARVAEIKDWYEASMKRTALLPGGIGEKIYQAADTGEIDQEIAPLLVRSFLRGGLDTTSSTISAALFYLASDPTQFALFREDPDRSRGAFEEAMRLETPIQAAARLTMRDVDIDGLRVPANSKIIMMLGCANRDPDFWVEPDRFDIERKTFGHLALGNGVHMCVGQMIARLEGECLLRAVAKHAKTLTLAGDPVRKLNNNLRSLRALPLAMIPS